MKARMRRLSVSVDSAIVDQSEDLRNTECTESSFQERVRKLLSSPLSRRKSASSGATAASREGSKLKVFGSPLSCLTVADRPPACHALPSAKDLGIPFVMTRLCDFIERESGLNQEGLFRISANVRLVERLKNSFDESGDAPLEESGDVAAAAALLKQFLRELPQPVIPSHLNQPFLAAIRSAGTDCKERLKPLVAVLPNENFIVLKYLCSFLHRVSLNEDSNRMNSFSLGIVFGPNIFRVSPEDYKEYKDHAISGPNQIMSLMISECEYIFEEDMHRTSCLLRASSVACDSTASPKRKNKVKRRGVSEGEDGLCHRLNSHIIPILILNNETLSTAMPTRKSLLSDRKRRQSKLLGAETPLLCRSSSEERPPSTHSFLSPSPDFRRSLSTDEIGTVEFVPGQEGKDSANCTNSPSDQLMSQQKDMDTACCQTETKRGSNEQERRDTKSEISLTVESASREHRKSWPRQQKDLEGIHRKCSYVDLSSSPKIVSSITRHLSSSEACVSPSACRSYLSQRSKRLSDPSVAPSPPQDQEFLISTNQPLAAASFRTTIVREERKKIHGLKKKLREFEYEFEQEYGREATLHDKEQSLLAHSLMQQIMKMECSLRDFKQMSSHDLDANSDDNPEIPTDPKNLLETLVIVQKELDSKRRAAGRPCVLESMTREEVADEKTDLQKALLRFEALHGRPKCKDDRDVMRPLYDRYRSVKRMLSRAPSGEAEHSASELPPILEHAVLTITSQSSVTRDTSRNDKHKNPLLVAIPDPQKLDDLHERSLHELPVAELSVLLHQSRLEKRQFRRIIKQFEDGFLRDTGRKAEKGDRGDVSQVYARYKNVKGRVRLLEALITKTEKTKRQL